MNENRSISGRLLGSSFENKLHSRNEVLAIAKKEFETRFYKRLRQWNLEKEQKLVLGLEDVSGALAIGFFVPSRQDIELVHESLGTPSKSELQNQTFDIEMDRIRYIRFWRNRRWNELYGSLEGIINISKKIKFEGDKDTAVQMIVDGKWQNLTSQDIAYQMFRASGPGYRYPELNAAKGISYSEAKTLISKSGDRNKVLDFEARVLGGNRIDILGRTHPEPGWLNDSVCIETYWSIRKNDRKATRAYYINRQIDSIWSYYAEKKKKAEELQLKKQNDERLRLEAIESSKREKIAAFQDELRNIDKNIPVLFEGKFDKWTAKAVQTVIAALQIHEGDYSSWKGGYDGFYSKAFAEHMKSRASEVKQLGGRPLEPGNLERFLEGLDELTALGIYKKPPPLQFD
ncbi:hypothetical protein MLD52_08020 [Puniceicoccaceae bacterium K14]|nr:hypothetical protein [Puniceicoccaceae bacterium K14]